MERLWCCDDIDSGKVEAMEIKMTEMKKVKVIIKWNGKDISRDNGDDEGESSVSG